MMQDSLAALGRTLIIVNPVAQSGAAADAAERLQRFLSLYCHSDAFELVRTERAGHATELAAGADSFDTVLALGGDGVVHEVVCGLMQLSASTADERPVLGVIPVGSGNDFARTLGLTDIADVSGTDFAPLLTSTPTSVDVLRVEYEPASEAVTRPADDACTAASGNESVFTSSARGNSTGRPSGSMTTRPVRTRITHAIETISFGLDAAIAIGTQTMRTSTGLSGTPLYMASGLKAFGLAYRDFPVRMTLDGHEPEDLRTIVCAVQNGPTYGSGFRICPDADPADGLLDICYAKGPVPRAWALKVFLSAKNGRHISSRFIHVAQAKRVEFAFAEDTYPIQADGEQLHARRMSIEVLPRALRVLKPMMS